MGNLKFVSVLVLGLVSVAVAQGPIGSTDPCLAIGFNDNLSCEISLDPLVPLVCYSRDQLCDGNDDCSTGSDEGENIAALECKSYFFSYIA